MMNKCQKLYKMSLVFLMMLLVAIPPSAKAADKLDNKSAEDLCFSYIRIVNRFTGFLKFGEGNKKDLAKNLRDSVVSGAEDRVAKMFQQEYSKYSNAFWLWDRKSKKYHKAKYINHVNGTKDYSLIVQIQDDSSWAVGEIGYLYTFYLRPESKGIGPFKRLVWKIAGVRISGASD